MKIIIIIIIFVSNSLISAVIKGKVKNKGISLIGVELKINELGVRTSSKKGGEFELNNVKVGDFELISFLTGFTLQNNEVTINDVNDTINIDIEMTKEYQLENDIVITGTRSPQNIHNSPILTNKIGSKLYESIQAISLSEGLNYSPGLRFETDCGNCGFSQVRMNGLQGQYTQILINSRAIYSALTGIYGLEMIPANMIERVEVVRGGGSVLYGGNAIAGTLNIITKEPTYNNYSVSNIISLTNIEKLENTLMFNGNLVSNDLRSGIKFYGINRNRSPWDANGDNFSEITKIEATSFGIDGYYDLDTISKLKYNIFSLNEERRGGNKFNYEVHQADIAEFLDHKIIGGSISYEKKFKNTQMSIYNSNQITNRHSYYGIGGRVIGIGDSINKVDLLALNSYGRSNDIVSIIGLQLSNSYETINLVYGSEVNYNKINDEFKGYNKLISQSVLNIGTYIQGDIKLAEKLRFIGGIRYEHINLIGDNKFGAISIKNNKTFDILVPRISLMYSITEDLKIRTSYAKGFRAPQAFNEDLHTEIISGTARFINISKNLKPELSDNLSFSIDKLFDFEEYKFNFICDVFYTKLNNAFILSNPIILENGLSSITKRNGKGSQVYGVNIECNFAYKYLLQIQTGLTFQKAEYISNEIIWSNLDSTNLVSTNRILKTPNKYAFLNATVFLNDDITFDIASIYTGKMFVAHVINPINQFTKINESNSFFELNLKISYDFKFSNNSFNFSFGCKNALNAYQKDLDFGINKDAAYIYGPSLPRSIYFTIKYEN